MDKIYYVYFLIDERNEKVFYVGKGKHNRAKSHISRAKKWKENNKNKQNVNKKLYNKILSIIDSGYQIKVEYVQKFLFEIEAFSLEEEKIKHFGLKNLCNLTLGGEGETKTQKTKNKIKEKHKQWRESPQGKEYFKHLSQTRKGKNNPMFGKKEETIHKQNRMKNCLSVPRWNKGLKNDPRSKGPPKGNLPHNTLIYEVKWLETSKTKTGLLKEISRVTNVPIVTIKRMVNKKYRSKKWSNIYSFEIVGKYNATSL